METEADARKMAELHATPKGELLFTTFQFSHKGVYNKENIHSVRHMWENLREVGILNHTIVISYHAPSCQVMWEHGIPCFLDRHLPQPESLPGPVDLPTLTDYSLTSPFTCSERGRPAGQYKTDVPHWYQKYAWALKFIEMGYVTVFIEMGAPASSCYLSTAWQLFWQTRGHWRHSVTQLKWHAVTACRHGLP